MTESEWLASAHPMAMLDHLDFIDALTDRKQRLLDCAGVRRLWHLLPADARATVEVAERFADGLADPEELRDARGNTLAAVEAEAERNAAAINSGVPRDPVRSPNRYCALSAAAGTAWEFHGGTDPLGDAAEALSTEGETEHDPDAEQRIKVRRLAERRQQVVLLREVFGNPFQPATFSTSWRTSTAVMLARQMYESRDFSIMPILADALMDAGCDDDSILSHCHDPQAVHVRGCWVVDLVLGKE